jgi:hypothetical protein
MGGCSFGEFFGFGSALRVICVLCVSAVSFLPTGIHRRDAENAELTQRRNQRALSRRMYITFLTGLLPLRGKEKILAPLARFVTNR